MPPQSSKSPFTEKWVTPTDPKKDYTGQTVLVTGANAGLGLETAKRLAASGAELVITTRSAEKGKQAADEIKQSTPSAKVTPLVLDMSSHAGIDAFINTLQPKLHACILNAGVIAGSHQTTADGFEETIQVNTVSTVYLALLLLPRLLDTAKTDNVQTRLVFVSSRNSTQTTAFPSPVVRSSKDALRAMSAPEAFAGLTGPMALYSQSKLALEHAMRRIAQLPALRDKGKFFVVVNSVCPGAVSTSLARNISRVWMLPVIVAFRVLAQKPVSAGATVYLQALAADCPGRMWVQGGVFPEWEFVTSQEGRAYGDKIWQELRDVVSTWSPDVLRVLE